MKYIDADLLRKEIDRRYNEYSAKKKTDDFIYYSGMADALDLFEQFLDTLSEEPDKSLEEEAGEWAENEAYGKSDAEFEMAYKGFIAGAKWQAEQDDRDVVFWKGMQYAYARLKEEAEGVVQDHGQFINFGDGKYIDLDPTLENKPIVELADGDKVRVIIIKDDESD